MSQMQRPSIQRRSTGIRLPIKFLMVAAILLVAFEAPGAAAAKCKGKSKGKHKGKGKGKGKSASSESSMEGIPFDTEYGGISTSDSSPASTSNGTSIESAQCFCPCFCGAPRQPPQYQPNQSLPPQSYNPPDTQAGNSGYCGSVANWNSDGFEAQMLQFTNQARSQGRTCGYYGYFPAANPLRANAKLKCSARKHSEDMGRNNYFAHNQPGTGEDGGGREKEAGYNWRTWGENIAGGWDSPATTYDKWLNSPPHCSNLMKADFTELGVGYYAVPSGINSQYNNYWTQNFGTQQ